MILSSLFIGVSPGRGRGVFTNKNLTAGEFIEISPVIVMSGEERILLDQTLLHDYIFLWGREESECCVALGYLSIYNHNFKPNAEYEMDFELSVIRIKTIRNIKKGEEIFINYNGTTNESKPLWFDPVPDIT
jgi:uncharacterized protein